MAKVPVVGRSKTRLARDIGVGAATAFARHGLRITLARLARDSRWETLLAVAPDVAVGSSALPHGVARFGQGRGDLGQRMQSIFALMSPGPVIIVGSDIPAIRPADIARAFRLLGAADAVFGPATDGGYWLVGMKRRPHLLTPFANVRWSSRHALADTRAHLEGHAVGLTATHGDVDDEESLIRSRHLKGRVIAPK